MEREVKKNSADWEKSNKEAKVRTGPYCLLRWRRRKRRKWWWYFCRESFGTSDEMLPGFRASQPKRVMLHFIVYSQLQSKEGCGMKCGLTIPTWQTEFTEETKFSLLFSVNKDHKAISWFSTPRSQIASLTNAAACISLNCR